MRSRLTQVLAAAAILASACGSGAAAPASSVSPAPISAPVTTATSPLPDVVPATTTSAGKMTTTDPTLSTVPDMAGPLPAVALDVDLAGGKCPVDVALAAAVIDPKQATPPAPEAVVEVPIVYGILERPTEIRSIFDGVVAAVEPSPNFYGDGRWVRVESPGVVVIYEFSFGPFPEIGRHVLAGESLGQRDDRLQIRVETPDGRVVDGEELLSALGCSLGLPEISSIEVGFFDGSRWEVVLPETVEAAVNVQSNARLEVDGAYVADASLWPHAPDLDVVWDVGLPELQETHVRDDGLRAESWWLTPGGCCGYLTWLDLPSGGAFVVTSSSPLKDWVEFIQSIEIDAEGRLTFTTERFALTDLETVISLRIADQYLGGGQVVILEDEDCSITSAEAAPCGAIRATLHSTGVSETPLELRPVG